MDIQKRSLNEVESVLEYAKLERSEIKPLVQCVYFSEELDNESVKLLQLDTPVLEAINAGDELIIRGEKTDGAVLCTSTSTYDIKEAEISNGMLITSDLQFGQDLSTEGEPSMAQRQVGSVLHNYYELRPIKPRVKKLKTILMENQYSGQECEEDHDHTGRKYTMTDILNLVQASKTEITEALEKLQACMIDGYWRVLDFDFLMQVVNHIIQLCEENDWLDTGIPLEECLTTLMELYPRCVLEHVIKSYCDKVEQSVDPDDEQKLQIDMTFYRLNEDKICCFFAELCLRNASKFNLQQFLSTWEKSVPAGMKTSLSQIEGMALIDRNSSPEVIWYFPVDDLPEDVGERFTVLFKERQFWTLDEISPYIRGLTTAKQDVQALLMKYARSSVKNGVKVYSSRKQVS